MFIFGCEVVNQKVNVTSDTSTTISICEETTTTFSGLVTVTTNVNSEKLNISKNFLFEMSKNVSVKVIVKDENNNCLKNVPVEFYKKVSFNEGKIIFNEKIQTNISSQNGLVETTLLLPNYLKHIGIKTIYTGCGIVNNIVVEIIDNKVYFEHNNKSSLDTFNLYVEKIKSSEIVKSRSIGDNNSPHTSNYLFMGEWDKNGKPLYLEENSDIIDVKFKERVNFSLPEAKDLSKTHPEYLKDNLFSNIVVEKKTDIYITFFHEGAGWKNTLGYYTYNKNSPINKIDDIKNITIIFPNLTYSVNNGALIPGNKVKIGTFEKDTVIGFVIISKGWENGTVGEGIYKFYSDKNLNPEVSDDNKGHSVLLKDNETGLYVIGFEDNLRDNNNSNNDNDFNDAMFYISSTVKDSIEDSNVTVIGEKVDVDNDGIDDNVEEYSEDTEKIFNNYYPAENIFGTLAFEDLWPWAGDYDFNDLVLGYNFNQITNKDNLIVELDVKIQIKAIGAWFSNGFGIELPISQDKIKKITGIKINDVSMINLDDKNLEQNQEKTVIIVFDDTRKVTNYLTEFFNTENDVQYFNPVTIDFKIEFNNPISFKELGEPPYNPFMFVNGDRNREIHLAGKNKTTLYKEYNYCDEYYITTDNMPFAINIPEEWQYPIERVSILKAYLKFREWAESNGELYKDWYKDIHDYKNKEYLYEKK